MFDPYDPTTVSPIRDGEWSVYGSGGTEADSVQDAVWQSPLSAVNDVQDPVRPTPVPAPADRPAADDTPRRRGLFRRAPKPEPEPLPPWRPVEGKNGVVLYPVGYKDSDPTRDRRRMEHPRPRDKSKAATMWWGSLRGIIVPLTYMREGQHPYVRRHARAALNAHLTTIASAVPVGVSVLAMVSANQEVAGLVPLGSIVMVVLAWVALAVLYHLHCSTTGVTRAGSGEFYDPPAFKFLHPVPKQIRDVSLTGDAADDGAPG